MNAPRSGSASFPFSGRCRALQRAVWCSALLLGCCAAGAGGSTFSDPRVHAVSRAADAGQYTSLQPSLQLLASIRGRVRTLRGGAPAGGGNKAKVKKIVDDKTFGLKNKNKSRVVQKYVHAVEQQARDAVTDKKKAAMAAGKKKAKEEEERRALEMKKLFVPVEKAAGPEKTAKEELEDYEYQSSIQATAEEKLPIDFEYFTEWVKKNAAKHKALIQGKKAKRQRQPPKGAHTGRVIFETQAELVVDDADAESSWMERGEEGEEDEDESESRGPSGLEDSEDGSAESQNAEAGTVGGGGGGE
ncbi:hypothetical protein T484DRAFT_2017453, partial [Baffinella frigidus]